jgi:phenylacetate-CoA ligase
MQREGIEMDVKSTVTTGDILTKSMRKLINNVLNTEVFDHYACAEFGRIAFECELHNYHLSTDALIIETVRDGESVIGERGNIVVTSLFNYLMPLIRYDIGDIGKIEIESCECGRKLPLLKKIYGRSKKLIILNSGKIFTETDLLNCLSQIKHLYNFQIKYKGKNKFLVKYSSLSDSDSCEYLILRSLKKIFKEENFVQFKQSSHIPKSPGGKFNFIEVLQ